jgi:hypothetical protein
VVPLPSRPLLPPKPIIVENSPQKFKVSENLTASISKINYYGAVTVVFSHGIIVPGNFSQINSTVLEVKVNGGSHDVDSKFLKIDKWNVTSMKLYSG